MHDGELTDEDCERLMEIYDLEQIWAPDVPLSAEVSRHGVREVLRRSQMT
jgi:hypothetical protein